jgi:hypothetical protein
MALNGPAGASAGLACAWRAVLLASMLPCAACETTVEQSTSARPMPSKPVEPPPAPVGAKANSMAMLVLGPKAQDSNGNGRADLVTVEVFLFAEPHPTPIFEEGRFVFELQPCPGEQLGELIPPRVWSFEGPQATAARGRAMIGPSHRFSLSLLETGGDVLPCAGADLTARFEPADGRSPVRAVGVRSILLGEGVTR